MKGWILRAPALVLLVATVMGLASISATAQDEPLYVALIWHNHQPFYKNTATGLYMMPWVRMHAAKDYCDMVAILKDYPNVRLGFNYVPSLILQLDEYEAGAKDIQLILSEKPASELTREDKESILRRFFDANWERMIKRYSRYWQLLQKRGEVVSDSGIAEAIEKYTEDDFRDLQVWFNLAWLDPDFIEEDAAIQALVKKGAGFTEHEKQQVLDKHLEIVGKVIPLHKEMQDRGQIEVTTTPFYHPIMPLLYDVNLARIASPNLELPGEPFAHPVDVEAQLRMAIKSYEDHFARKPKGLWPSEQAVGQDIVGLVHDAGFEWMVSSEGILARSLGISLRDSAGNVARPDLLYKPYLVEEDGKAVAILFRDIVLSDKVGFSYSGMNGTAAALDFMEYLRKVERDLSGEPGPHIVTIALDGENCWEYYENDGKEFLHALYTMLDQDPGFKTVTVSEFLKEHPATAKIPKLYTGSWIDSNLETWIGETEENRAWDYLAKARRTLADYTQEAAARKLDAKEADALEKAWDEFYAAEGSDWFWWYGDDQDSGQDHAFDELFRIHLQNVYSYIGRQVPGYLYMPIIPKEPAVPNAKMKDFMREMEVDGIIQAGEWNEAALYFKQEAATLPGGEEMNILRALWLGVDAENLYVRIDIRGGLKDVYGTDLAVALYLANPRRMEQNSMPRWSREGPDATVVGFSPGTEMLVDFGKVAGPGTGKAQLAFADGNEAWVDARPVTASGVNQTIEIQLPFADINLRPGDVVSIAAVASQDGRNVDMIPCEGPCAVRVPEVVRGTTLFRWDDPQGDDYGPGTYTYPLSQVFTPGVFDMLSFEVLDVQDEIVFQVEFAAEITNPWNSPIGVSLQTIDIYIDTDGKPGRGETDALGGRNVTFSPECAWEYAIWTEGWMQRIFTPDGRELDGAVRVSVDTLNNVISIHVPKSVLGMPEPHWGYQVFILSQEGYAATGNLRAREVQETAQEWRLGGGHDSHVDPNVLDLLAPLGMTQEEILGAYDINAGKLAEVPMVYGSEE
jgi:alpha-amylase/alpha-mannosidase (GH57 family)